MLSSASDVAKISLKMSGVKALTFQGATRGGLVGSGQTVQPILPQNVTLFRRIFLVHIHLHYYRWYSFANNKSDPLAFSLRLGPRVKRRSYFSAEHLKNFAASYYSDCTPGRTELHGCADMNKRRAILYTKPRPQQTASRRIASVSRSSFVLADTATKELYWFDTLPPQ